MSSVTERLLAFLVPDTSPLSWREKLLSAAAAFVAIGAVTWLSARFVPQPGGPVLVASVGAAAVLLFAVHHSPLAHPWAFVVGHLLSAAVGITCARFIPDLALAAAAAVGLSIFVMQVFNCLHPPGGAVALVPVLGGAQVHELGYGLLLIPLALNLMLMVPLALLINNRLPHRHYPYRRRTVRDDVHHHDDPPVLDRLGLHHEDLRHALQDMDTYLDVSEEDLSALYRNAAMYGYKRRMGVIRCADIMSHDVISAEYDTELEDAWALLRYHKIKIMPVVDTRRRVIGVISLVDFLKRADLKSYASFEERLLRFIRRTPGLEADKPEVVGHIMARKVFSVAGDTHIADLIPMLSERGLHHVPVVDEGGHLQGIVTQSDLIAALYGGAGKV